MRWFQLHTNCLYDPKIVKLIKKHGAAGFGVYSGVNVLIAEHDVKDLTLEHDTEGLQNLFNEPNVKAIVETCISLGLFTVSEDGLIQNLKIAKYIGNWQKRSKTYVEPTETLQRAYRDPTAKKERREEKEENKNDLATNYTLAGKESKPSITRMKEIEKLNKRQDEIFTALPNSLSDDIENALRQELKDIDERLEQIRLENEREKNN